MSHSSISTCRFSNSSPFMLGNVSVAFQMGFCVGADTSVRSTWPLYLKECVPRIKRVGRVCLLVKNVSGIRRDSFTITQPRLKAVDVLFCCQTQFGIWFLNFFFFLVSSEWAISRACLKYETTTEQRTQSCICISRGGDQNKNNSNEKYAQNHGKRM